MQAPCPDLSLLKVLPIGPPTHVPDDVIRTIADMANAETYTLFIRVWWRMGEALDYNMVRMEVVLKEGTNGPDVVQMDQSEWAAHAWDESRAALLGYVEGKEKIEGAAKITDPGWTRGDHGRQMQWIPEEKQYYDLDKHICVFTKAEHTDMIEFMERAQLISGKTQDSLQWSMDEQDRLAFQTILKKKVHPCVDKYVEGFIAGLGLARTFRAAASTREAFQLGVSYRPGASAAWTIKTKLEVTVIDMAKVAGTERMLGGLEIRGQDDELQEAADRSAFDFSDPRDSV